MKTALVVEDNVDNMELITYILKHHGYETLWADTGMQSIEQLVEAKPDFVILDIQLPDIDGYEVLRRIRATEFGRVVPVIAMTSYAMAGDEEKLLAAGCNGYIEKPIDPKRVMSQIRKVIE